MAPKSNFLPSKHNEFLAYAKCSTASQRGSRSAIGRSCSHGKVRIEEQKPVPERELVVIDKVMRKVIGDINNLPYKDDHDLH